MRRARSKKIHTKSKKYIVLNPYEDVYLQGKSLVCSASGDIQKALRNEICQIFRKKMQATDSLKERMILLTYTREIKRIPLTPGEKFKDIELL